MRTRFPDLRTLPSRSVAAFSLSPITATSSFLPLNWKDEARAATRSPRILVSTLRSSSASPSEKYSSSSPRLRLTKGSTAIEGISRARGPDAAEAGVEDPEERGAAVRDGENGSGDRGAGDRGAAGNPGGGVTGEPCIV